MSVEYNVDFPDGSSASFSPGEISEMLSAQGVSASPSMDGTTIQYDMGGQMMEMPANEIVQNMTGGAAQIGFGQGTDFTTVSPGMRMAVESLPSDSMKRKYLEFALSQEGLEDAQIIGQGSDWAYLDPSSGEVKALTNAPGMDISDWGQVGTEGARFLGAGLGGASGLALGGGATGGFAAIPGAMSGAAVGSGLARTAMQGILAGTDESYADLLESLSSEEQMALAKDIALTSTVDAAGSLIPIAGGSAVRALSPKVANFFGSAPISKAVERGAKLAEDAAQTTARTSKYINTPVGRGIAAEVGPGLGMAQLGGFAAQAPAAAIRSAPKVKNFFRSKLGMSEIPESVKPADRFGEKAARAFRRNFGDEPFEQDLMVGRDAASLMSQAFEDAGKGIGARIDSRKAQKVAEEAYENLTGGTGPVRPRDLAMEQSKIANLAEEAETAAQRYGRMGKNVGTTIGRTAEGLGAIGRGVETGIDTAMGVGLKGVEYGAKGLQGGFGAARLGAQVLSPLEARAYGYVPGRLAEENYVRGR